MKKQIEQPRYKVVEAKSHEELQDALNKETGYKLAGVAVTSYWMHMQIVHEYTAVLLLNVE